MSTRWDDLNVDPLADVREYMAQARALQVRATWSCTHLSAMSWRDERAQILHFECPTCGCSAYATFESRRPPTLGPCVHQGVPPTPDQVAQRVRNRLRDVSAGIMGHANPNCLAGIPGCACTLAPRPSVEELLARLDVSDRGGEEWVGPDAYSLDASSPAAEQEIAAWREILDSAKARRRP